MIFPLFLALLFFTTTPSPFSSDRSPAQAITAWPQWSGDIKNNHNLTPENPLLSTQNVSGLTKLWSFPTPNSVVATPTLKDGTLYFTDVAKLSLEGLFTGGRLYAIDTATGKKRWSQEIEHYTKSGLRNFSRTSPAISGNALVIGDSINNVKFIAQALVGFHNLPGTSVMAINRHTGELFWKTEVESHFASRITMSPVIFDNKVFVGISSQESEIPLVRGATYKCCSFRGSMVALSLTTGKILWKTKMIDDSVKEVAGAPVWGSSPPIDVKRRRIYIGTGNNYNTSRAFLACFNNEHQTNRLSVNEATTKCASIHDSSGNRFDSIVALNLDTGKIVWSRKTIAYDAWNVGCGSSFTPLTIRNEKVCPRPEGIDSDFAQAPMLITTKYQGQELDLLVAGQKNGMFWAVRADNGDLLWKYQVGPGGKLGGHQWGSATDGKRIYFQTTNLEHKPVTMIAGRYKGQTIKGGFWGALNVLTGKVIWQTPDPATAYPLKGEGINHIMYGLNLGRGHFAAPMGALTYYNEMVFAGSLSGLMVAMDASTGTILWKKQNKGSVVAAPSIVDDVLYWGVGYHMGFAGNEVMALRP